MLAAGYRLISLWISQVASSLASHCLGIFVVQQVFQFGLERGSATWHQTIPLFITPFVLLAPMNGALSNSLPKRWILAGSAAFCFCITALLAAIFAAGNEPWLWCTGLGLNVTGYAIFCTATYALLPAAAQDARWPLNRLMGWIEMGGAMAAVAGLLLGYCLDRVSWSEARVALGLESSLDLRTRHGHLPVAVAAALGFNLVAVLAALWVHFPSDVRRPASAAQGIADFFGDCKIFFGDDEARRSLLGLAYFLSLIVAGSGAVLGRVLSPGEVAQALLLVGLGLAGGCLLAAVQGHPRRMLGLVPPAASGLLAALLWAAAGSNLGGACLLLGLMGGLVTVPLRTAYQLRIPAEARGNGMALMNMANTLSIGALFLSLSALTRLGILTPAEQLWLLAVPAAAGTLLAWRVLLRETIEQLGEIVLWPMYCVRARGPGRFAIPVRGPLLVIANHTAWFDPLWLAKLLPRRLTPMMTSQFFDLPILHWLMRNVAGAIRVPDVAFRREAPELQEAVACLDRGGCVLIFPEGSMKRRPEQSLRHFGQGVWRILRQRPQTPVVVCWIEGGWGSFTSYCGGPPTANKHLDWRRQIDIAMDMPQRLDPALLADQHACRNYLMRACLNARLHLGLQPLPLQQGATKHPVDDGQHEVRQRGSSAV